MGKAVLELFWDVGSPYSYLAMTQVAGLRQRTGATVRLRPFLLGGVFKAAGNTMPASNPAKARYMLQDLARWRAHYGVPLRLPGVETPFPLTTIVPMRAAVAADQEGGGDPFAMALVDAYWVHGVDVSTPEAVAQVAEGVGLDADSLLSAAQTQEVKDALRKSSDEAVARGAFGAPSIFVGDELFFGNDRLDFAEAALIAEEKK
jgi:2-hydroxychromene-2-carboxylate isomerase